MPSGGRPAWHRNAPGYGAARVRPAQRAARPPPAPREVEKIARSTASLPRVEAAIDKVADDASVLPAMYERMAAIEEAMPTLVDVQRRLADLPSTMEHLEGEMGGLGETLTRLLASLDKYRPAIGPGTVPKA